MKTTTVLYNKLFPGVTAMLALFVLSGCASRAGIHAESTLLDQDHLVSSQLNESWPDMKDWWKQYQDPQLNALITLAMQNNPSLKASEARVRQADAIAALAGSADGPRVDFSASMSRQHLSGYGLTPFPIGGTLTSLYDTGLSFNYIFDIWGKTRAEITAALSEKKALQIEANETRRILSLAISSRYFQYHALQTDLRLLKTLVAVRCDMMKILKAQNQAGIIQKDQVDWMNTQLQADQKMLVDVNAQSEKTKNALAVLVGATAVHSSFLKSVNLPSPRLTDLQGLNINMLAQRSDVRAARWRVESCLQSVKAAKAEFYPAFSLYALAGFNAMKLADWFKRNAYQTILTPALNLPIFYAGELRANLRGKTAQYDQAVENYNQTLIIAVQDAADKYTDLQSAAQYMGHELNALQAAHSAAKMSAARYRGGILPRLNYRDAQSRNLQIERQFNAAQNQRLQSELAMVQAMGWDDIKYTNKNTLSVGKQ